MKTASYRIALFICDRLGWLACRPVVGQWVDNELSNYESRCLQKAFDETDWDSLDANYSPEDVKPMNLEEFRTWLTTLGAEEQ